MPDFRMNKNKPKGSVNQTAIAGYNDTRRAAPAPPAAPPTPKFEVTPDLAEQESSWIEKVPVANTLGELVTRSVLTTYPETIYEDKQVEPEVSENEDIVGESSSSSNEVVTSDTACETNTGSNENVGATSTTASDNTTDAGETEVSVSDTPVAPVAKKKVPAKKKTTKKKDKINAEQTQESK